MIRHHLRRSLELSASRSAMNLPFRYVAAITGSFIKLEMKSPGGKGETLMPSKSHEGFGKKRTPKSCR